MITARYNEETAAADGQWAETMFGAIVAYLTAEIKADATWIEQLNGADAAWHRREAAAWNDLGKDLAGAGAEHAAKMFLAWVDWGVDMAKAWNAAITAWATAAETWDRTETAAWDEYQRTWKSAEGAWHATEQTAWNEYLASRNEPRETAQESDPGYERSPSDGKDPGETQPGPEDVGLFNFHEDRNAFNFAYRDEQTAKDNGWIRLDREYSVYHMHDAPGNSKYVSPDGHFEAVYDENGRLVTSDQNRGTFNYYSPNEWGGVPHVIVDVIPYWVFGNSTDSVPLVNRVFGADGLSIPWDYDAVGGYGGTNDPFTNYGFGPGM